MRSLLSFMSAIQDSSEKSVVDNIQEPSSGLDEKAAPNGKSYKCVVVSLIRHAEVRTHFSLSILLHFLSCPLQCLGNIRSRHWEADDAPNPLTERGQNQAVSLGTAWADTPSEFPTPTCIRYCQSLVVSQSRSSNDRHRP